MSLTLAIDCAMRRINLGLGSSGEPLGSLSFDSGPKQSESLPDLVGRFMEMHGAACGDLGKIAVTVGPGYYTGIRVGLSYASAFAESLSAGLVPISTLETLACGFESSNFLVVPLIKARRNAVYCAAYRGGENILPPSFMDVHDFISTIESFEPENDKILLLGEDSALFAELATFNSFKGRCDIGAGMIRICEKRATIDPVDARALYLRNPD